MIKYETEKSPFFEANKSYSEKLEVQLKSLNAESSGYCNSFGYEIEASFNRNNLSFYALFKKKQSTQNGVVMPVNARDDFESNITVTGFKTVNEFSFGKSTSKRIFMKADLKSLLPSPYYAQQRKHTDYKFLEQIYLLAKANNFDSIILTQNHLKCKLHAEISNLQSTIDALELILKNAELS